MRCKYIAAENSTDDIRRAPGNFLTCLERQNEHCYDVTRQLVKMVSARPAYSLTLRLPLDRRHVCFYNNTRILDEFCRNRPRAYIAIEAASHRTGRQGFHKSRPVSPVSKHLHHSCFQDTSNSMIPATATYIGY